MTKKKVIKDRWVCDICRIAAFDDFDEACRHESSCGKAEINKVNVASKGEINIDTAKNRDSPSNNTKGIGIDDDDDDTLVTKSKDEAACIDFEDTPILPKRLSFKNTNKQSITDANSGNNDNAECAFVNCEICSPSKDMDKEDCTTNTNTTVKSQAMPRRHTKSKRDPDRSKKQQQHQQRSPEVQIIATKPKSLKCNAPTAPLFLKPKNTTNANIVSSTTSRRNKKANQPKTPRTIAFASIFEKPTKSTATTDVNANANTDPSNGPKSANNENGHCNPSPPSISSEEKEAILAEHRVAEFASNRRKQQQEEKERQKRREENRRLNYEAKQKEKEHDRTQRQQQQQQRQQHRMLQVKELHVGSVASIFQTDKNTPTPNIKRNSGNRLQSPLDLTETPKVHVPSKVAENGRRKNKPGAQNGIGVDVRKYPPRFSCPSFVADVDVDADVDVGGKRRSTGSPGSCMRRYHASVMTSKYQESVDSVSLPKLPLYQHDSVVNVDDPVDDAHMQDGDFLYKCFSSVLHPCTPSLDADVEASTNSNQLWSDKYSMKSIPQDVYGYSNREVAEDLVGFINNWKGHRQQIYEVRAERAAKLRGSKKKKVKKRSRSHEYDDGDFMSDDEDSGLRSVYLLTGETGSGKTSMVHAAAHHCHCALIEINTTAERGGKALKKEIEECTQSLSNVALLKRDTSSGGILKEDDNEESSGSSLAVILIDEGASRYLIAML